MNYTSHSHASKWLNYPFATFPFLLISIFPYSLGRILVRSLQELLRFDAFNRFFSRTYGIFFLDVLHLVAYSSLQGGYGWPQNQLMTFKFEYNINCILFDRPQEFRCGCILILLLLLSSTFPCFVVICINVRLLCSYNFSCG